MIICYVLNKPTQICFQVNYKAPPWSGRLRNKSFIIQQDKKSFNFGSECKPDLNVLWLQVSKCCC